MFIKTSKGNWAKQHDLIFLCLFMWTVIDSKHCWTFISCSLQLGQTTPREWLRPACSNCRLRERLPDCTRPPLQSSECCPRTTRPFSFCFWHWLRCHIARRSSNQRGDPAVVREQQQYIQWTGLSYKRSTGMLLLTPGRLLHCTLGKQHVYEVGPRLER